MFRQRFKGEERGSQQVPGMCEVSGAGLKNEGRMKGERVRWIMESQSQGAL